MKFFQAAVVFVTLLYTIHYGAKASVFKPEISFGSKLWQLPKPYIGVGVALSSLAQGHKEDLQGSFTDGLSQFRNMTIHAGMRINGFFGAEIAYARPYKKIFDDAGSHQFSGDLLAFKGMFYPLSIGFGIFSAEFFLVGGISYTINATSSYTNSAGAVVHDRLNNTANILYGGGLQIGFIKYVSLRFELDALSPLNGMSFGAPYGNVMLLYNLTVSFYPF